MSQVEPITNSDKTSPRNTTSGRRPNHLCTAILWSVVLLDLFFLHGQFGDKRNVKLRFDHMEPPLRIRAKSVNIFVKRSGGSGQIYHKCPMLVPGLPQQRQEVIALLCEHIMSIRDKIGVR